MFLRIYFRQSEGFREANDVVDKAQKLIINISLRYQADGWGGEEGRLMPFEAIIYFLEKRFRLAGPESRWAVEAFQSID